MTKTWGACVFERSIGATLALMLAATTAAIVWGTDRGLGLADEGVYLLAARYPAEIEQNVSAVFAYTGVVFKLVGYDPQLFRLAGLAAIVLSALAFWVGYQKLVLLMFPGANRAQHLRLNSLVFLQIGGILYYQWAFAFRSPGFCRPASPVGWHTVSSR